VKLFDDEAESTARDSALTLLQATRADIIAKAMGIAVRLAKKNGSVTSTEVLERLRDEGCDPDQFDKRFIGVIFRYGWKRIGFKPLGSHKRPVSVWQLCAPALKVGDG